MLLPHPPLLKKPAQAGRSRSLHKACIARGLLCGGGGQGEVSVLTACLICLKVLSSFLSPSVTKLDYVLGSDNTPQASGLTYLTSFTFLFIYGPMQFLLFMNSAMQFKCSLLYLVQNLEVFEWRDLQLPSLKCECVSYPSHMANKELLKRLPYILLHSHSFSICQVKIINICD